MCVRTVPKRLEKCLRIPHWLKKSGRCTSASSSQSACDPLNLNRMTAFSGCSRGRISAELRSACQAGCGQCLPERFGERDRKFLLGEHSEIGAISSYCDSQANGVMEREADVRCCCGYQCTPGPQYRMETSESSPQIALSSHKSPEVFEVSSQANSVSSDLVCQIYVRSSAP